MDDINDDKAFQRALVIARPATKKLVRQYTRLKVSVVRVRCESCGLAALISPEAFKLLERRREEGKETEVRCDKCNEKEPAAGPEVQSEELAQGLNRLAKQFEMEVRKN